MTRLVTVCALVAGLAVSAMAQTGTTNMEILRQKIKADKKLVVAANLQLTDAEGKASCLSTNQGLSSNYILSLHVDRDDTLWVGTDGGSGATGSSAAATGALPIAATTATAATTGAICSRVVRMVIYLSLRADRARRRTDRRTPAEGRR